MRRSATALPLGLFLLAAISAINPQLHAADPVPSDATVSLDSCAIELTGDSNQSGEISSADIILTIRALFKAGPWPEPCLAAADVNCDSLVTAADVVYLVSFVFKGGPAPCDVCQFGRPGESCFVDFGEEPLFPVGIGSNWTYQVYDTFTLYTIIPDTVYHLSVSVDTVVLTLTGMETIDATGEPAVVWEFNPPTVAANSAGLLNIFYTVHSVIDQAHDTLFGYHSTTSIGFKYRTPVPMEVGQEWCDYGCGYGYPPRSRVASIDSVYMNEQFLGEAYMLERDDLGAFEGYWFRTEWIIPQLGYAKIAYTDASHDGGGNNWGKKSGVFYLIDYALTE